MSSVDIIVRQRQQQHLIVYWCLPWLFSQCLLVILLLRQRLRLLLNRYLLSWLLLLRFRRWRRNDDLRSRLLGRGWRRRGSRGNRDRNAGSQWRRDRGRSRWHGRLHRSCNGSRRNRRSRRVVEGRIAYHWGQRRLRSNVSILAVHVVIWLIIIMGTIYGRLHGTRSSRHHR